jgi:hypothetical protein
MTNKLIVVLKSSPRSKSNSSILADEAAAGARSRGAEVVVFDLAAMHINPCDACDFCQEGDVGCSVKDDMVRYLNGVPVGTAYGTSLEAGDALNQPELLKKAYHLGEKIAE